jgi:hypothetical protein
MSLSLATKPLRNTPNSQMAIKKIGEFRKELDRFYKSVTGHLYSCGYDQQGITVTANEFDYVLAEIERDLQSELYAATRAIFGFLSGFDREWDKGYRPVVDADGRYEDDILFMSKLGSSYVRACRCEGSHDPSDYQRLYDILIQRSDKGEHDQDGYWHRVD